MSPVPTIAKFYLLDAVSPNTGTLPGAGDAIVLDVVTASSGDATGARTARDATSVAGSSNPDVESSITANADQTGQNWGHRRFVTRPLAAQTLLASSSWTFSYARSESNISHNQAIWLSAYIWRPSSGMRAGFNRLTIIGTPPTSAATEQAESASGHWAGSEVLLDGDILVFDVATNFRQGTSTAYTEQFAYNGTIEADTTSCASFVSTTVPLILYPPDQLVTAPSADQIVISSSLTTPDPDPGPPDPENITPVRPSVGFRTAE